MCPPDRPSPDTYDNNPQILPHFSRTPPLTVIPKKNIHRHGQPVTSTWDLIRIHLDKLYRKHRLQTCHHYGLYYAGSSKELEDPDRTRTVVMVMEMVAAELEAGKWRDVNAEARRILMESGLGGKHGVCLRYYKEVIDDFGVGSVTEIRPRYPGFVDRNGEPPRPSRMRPPRPLIVSSTLHRSPPPMRRVPRVSSMEHLDAASRHLSLPPLDFRRRPSRASLRERMELYGPRDHSRRSADEQMGIPTVYPESEGETDPESHERGSERGS